MARFVRFNLFDWLKSCMYILPKCSAKNAGFYKGMTTITGLTGNERLNLKWNYFTDCPQNFTGPCFRNGQEVLKQNEYDPVSISLLFLHTDYAPLTPNLILKRALLHIGFFWKNWSSTLTSADHRYNWKKPVRRSIFLLKRNIYVIKVNTSPYGFFLQFGTYNIKQVFISSNLIHEKNL